MFLVTGGAGFIGSHIVRALLEQGKPVRVLDDLSTGRESNLADVLGDVDFRKADLRDPEVCRSACQGVEAVFHQGAIPAVPRSIADPLTSFQVNVAGTHTLLLAAREAGVRRLVQASSSSVYGNQPELPKHEQMMVSPLSPYAAQKLAAEQLGVAFTESLGLEVVALRYFNVYGPRQDPSSGYAAVIPAFVSHLIEGKAPRIDGDGGQTRDFTFVEDVVRANLAAADAPKAPGCFFNVAGGERISINELFARCAEAVGATDVKPNYGPPRAGDVRDSLASIEHAKERLGWTPQVSLADGLKLTVAGYRAGL